MDSLNILDIIIFVILGFCLVRSLFRGFIMEVASIVGVVAGFILANHFFLDVGKYLRGYFPGFGYWEQAGFVAIFIASLVAANLLGMLVKKLAKLTLLSWMDRLLGASFGLLKGVLVSAILVAFLTLFLPANSNLMRRSAAVPYLKETSRYLMYLAPEEVRAKAREKEQGLKALLKGKVEKSLDNIKKQGRKIVEESKEALEKKKR